MFRIAFHQPQIPPNTGSTIRLAACTGAQLHLIRPLGFSLEDKQLRRAGLDYHDLAHVTVHESFADTAQEFADARIYAFTRNAETSYADIAYQPGDVLLFGRETDGLPDDVLDDPQITEKVRFPMVPNRRSLNLSNCAAIAVYEAWRQNGFG